MSSTFAGYVIGGSALNVDQNVLDIIGHNLANVNTPGYSRQVAEIQASQPFSDGTSAGQFGTGIELTAVTRVNDQLVGQRLVSATGVDNQLNSLSNLLNQVQNVYGEPGQGGISSQLTAFFNSFQQLSQDPENEADRSLVLQAGERLAKQFNQISNSLTLFQPQIQSNVQTSVQQVNVIAKQIATLNQQIQISIGQGQHPNDLEDQRDQLISQLGGIVGTQAVNEVDSKGQSTGRINLYVNGFALVDGNSANALPSGFTNSGNTLELTDGVNKVPVTSGSVTGLIKASGLISGYLTTLNHFASTFISSVNAQHEVGYGLDGGTGRPFFSGTDASSIQVDSGIVANIDTIAAASPPSNGNSVDPGNGNNALAIADISSQPLFGNATLGNYYASYISGVGADSQSYTQQASNQDQIVQQLQNLSSSVSGVSIDEETTHLLQYQQAYQAAARVITVMDGVLGTLLNSLGSATVG